MINPVELNTDEKYYANQDYMSVSSYKRFLKCEEEALLPFGDPTEAMLVGSYVDAYVTGDLDKFKREHPEILSTRGANKGELKSEFQLAEQICRKIDSDEVFRQFMSGEKQTVMTGEIFGVPWKIKMDSYSPHIAINDLKVMASVTNKKGEYIDFITPWGYDLQLAVYQEIVFQNTGEKLPCFICAVTKEKSINSVIVEIPQIILDIRLFEMKENLERIMQVRQGLIVPKRCEMCNHCISTRTTTPIISLNDLIR